MGGACCVSVLTARCVVSLCPLPAFVPAPPVAPVPSPAPMPPVHPPPPMEDEPVSKKLKSEDSLIPEEEFLRRNKVHECMAAHREAPESADPLGSAAPQGCEASSLHGEELLCMRE